jgi:phage terminase large subunit-like protein
MASNVAVAQDPAGNVKCDKSKSIEKIDGIVATIMAIGLAMVDPGSQDSIYETQGLRTL